MDCFRLRSSSYGGQVVASLLAMTSPPFRTHLRDPTAHFAWVVLVSSRLEKQRARGMPDARCTRGLVCKLCKECAHEHTGSAEAIRHSLRNGFTAYSALSPATNSSCHRRRRIGGLVEPGWARKDLRRLDTSNGCQNHTLLPYADAHAKDFDGPGTRPPNL